MANRKGKSGTSNRFYLGAGKGATKSLQIVIAVMKLSHLLLGRKVMTNLDSIFRSRAITLSTKVHLVKAMVFPVVMYGCEKETSVVPTLCDPMNYSLPVSSVHGIYQASVLEWVAIFFSRGSS